jgi:hypothetical protein
MNAWIKRVERALITRDLLSSLQLKEEIAGFRSNEENQLLLEQFSQDRAYLLSVLDDLINILSGIHVKISQNHYWNDFSVQKLRLIAESAYKANPTNFIALPENIQELTVEYVLSQPSENSESIACLHLLIVSVCYLEIFLQMNYTGPELSQANVDLYLIEGQHKYHLSILECDGNYTFPQVQVPLALIIARAIFSTLSRPSDCLWQYGVVLDTAGNLNFKQNSLSSTEIFSSIVSRSLSYHNWFSCRATVIHLRTLQKQSYSSVPTLWKECCDSYAILTNYAQSEGLEVHLLSQLYLEYGLSHHYAEFGDKVSAHLFLR